MDAKIGKNISAKIFFCLGNTFLLCGMEKQNEITLNGIEYIRKDAVQSVAMAEPKDGMPFVIIRTYSAGVHFGYLKERNGKEGTLIHARRVWYWKGAASLSQMAVSGVTEPKECKFSVPVPVLELTEIIEVLHCTNEAKINLEGVPQWKK